MDGRRTKWIEAFKLAGVMSAVAVAVALALNAFGNVSQTAVVIGVIVVGFVLSWVQSGRTPRRGAGDAPGNVRSGHRTTVVGHERHRSHRVATVRLHH